MSDAQIKDALQAVADDNAAIVRLAALAPLDYDRIRKSEAEQMGVRPVTLDREVARARGEAPPPEDDDPVEVPEPWSGAIDGSELAHEIARLASRHLVLPPGADTIVALWVLGTYCYDSFRLFPKLLISAATKRAGKSTLMELLEATCRSALLSSSATAAVIFRCVERWHPTLLLDEIDRWMKDNQEAAAIVNCGHTKRTATVLRVVGDDHTPAKFSVWGPMALSGIAEPEDTIRDRSVIVRMQRKRPDESRDRLPADLFEQLRPLRRKCERWAIDNASRVENAEPDVPPLGNDRAEDNWRVLLAIATAIGWQERARKVCVDSSGEGRDDEDGVATILLADIQRVFQHEKMFSDDLARALVALEERPWAEWRRGQPITPNSVARLLRAYRIRSQSIRIGAETRKGYSLVDFSEAFSRYVPLPLNSTVTTSQPTNGAGSSPISKRHTNETVTDEKTLEATNGAACDVVTLQNAPREPKQKNSGYPMPELDDQLDSVRAGTDCSIAEARAFFSDDDLTDLLSGELSVEAARHYLRNAMSER